MTHFKRAGNEKKSLDIDHFTCLSQPFFLSVKVVRPDSVGVDNKLYSSVSSACIPVYLYLISVFVSGPRSVASHTPW